MLAKKKKEKIDKLWPKYRGSVENTIKNRSVTKKQLTNYTERMRYVIKIYPNKAIYWLLEMQSAILRQKKLLPLKKRKTSALNLGPAQASVSIRRNIC